MTGAREFATTGVKSVSDPDGEILQGIADAGVYIAVLAVGLAQAGVGGLEDAAGEQAGTAGAAFTGAANGRHDDSKTLQRIEERFAGEAML